VNIVVLQYWFHPIFWNFLTKQKTVKFTFKFSYRIGTRALQAMNCIPEVLVLIPWTSIFFAKCDEHESCSYHLHQRCSHHKSNYFKIVNYGIYGYFQECMRISSATVRYFKPENKYTCSCQTTLNNKFTPIYYCYHKSMQSIRPHCTWSLMNWRNLYSLLSRIKSKRISKMQSQVTKNLSCDPL
jgi:hypothetical protein